MTTKTKAITILGDHAIDNRSGSLSKTRIAKVELFMKQHPGRDIKIVKNNTSFYRHKSHNRLKIGGVHGKYHLWAVAT